MRICLSVSLIALGHFVGHFLSSRKFSHVKWGQRMEKLGPQVALLNLIWLLGLSKKNLELSEDIKE